MMNENLIEPLCVCVICMENFNQKRKALSLVCGHSYCSDCSLKLIKNEKITCPECRESTRAKSTHDLSTNIAIMRICSDSDQLNQQNMFIKNIKQLRDEIINKLVKKMNHYDLYKSRMNNHTQSLNGLTNEADLLKHRIQFIQQFKEIQLDDLSYLNQTIKQAKLTVNFFNSKLKELNNGILKLKEIEQNTLINTLLIDLNQNLNQVLDMSLLSQDDLTKIDSQAKALNEIANRFKIIEKKYSPSLLDLQNSDKDVKLNDIIDGLEWDMKFAKFRIGFVGNSGKTKSSLINRLRNLPDPKRTDINSVEFKEEDEYDISAPTGTGETTKFAVKYSWKNRQSIQLKDFPGFGLTTSIEEYLEKYLKNDNCHLYIILYTERLTKTDIKLAKLIKTSLKRPVLMARSKTDIDFANTVDYLEDKSDENVFAELKHQLNYELNQEEFDSLFTDTFQRNNLKIFLISCKFGYEEKFEMKELIKEMFLNLPDELFSESDLLENGNRSNLFLSLSKTEIRNIKNKLQKRIINLSVLSAATDIIPIAGQIADLGIIIGEVTRYRDFFCLKKEYINELGKKYNISDDRVTNIIKIIAIDAKYVNIKNFVLSITGAVSVGVSIAQAVTSSVALGINLATFGAGCFISALISGPVSYILCKNVLTKALEQMELDALKIVELIHEEIKNKDENLI